MMRRPAVLVPARGRPAAAAAAVAIPTIPAAPARANVKMLTSLATPPVAQPRLLEVSHVAHRLRASQEHVRRLLRAKKLAAIRLGTRWRVDPADLQAFIDAQRMPR
jgi:excisionase family DNA binding protein